MLQDIVWQRVEQCCRNINWVIGAGFLLLMEQHFRLFLGGFVLIRHHVIEVYVLALMINLEMWYWKFKIIFINHYYLFLKCFHSIKYQTGESGLEERIDVFKEWTSRRPWNERKRANKCGTPQLLSRSDPPELIYYGRHSGVIGLTKGELYKTVSDNEIASHGYDKVTAAVSSNSSCIVLYFIWPWKFY